MSFIAEMQILTHQACARKVQCFSAQLTVMLTMKPRAPRTVIKALTFVMGLMEKFLAALYCVSTFMPWKHPGNLAA